METIAIIGTGLIGGSIGLALKAAKLPEVEVVGFDDERSNGGEAKRMGAVDRSVPTYRDAVKDANLVIVATPPLAVREVFEEIAPHLREGAIVTDTASTKSDVARWARELLPEPVAFVGGHPMAGKETQGIKAAEAGLFRDKVWAVTPSPSAGEGAVKSVLGLIGIVGAEPLFVDAEEHDQYVAAISHLPLVMSAALFSLVRNSPSWDDIAPLAASGFRDMTRLASGEPAMAHDICATNGEAVVHWLDRYITELMRYREQITGDRKALFRTFAEAQLQRDTFMVDPRPRRRSTYEVPSTKDTMSGMLFGGLLNSKMAQFEKDLDGKNKRGRRSVIDDD